MGIKFLCPNGHKLHVKSFLASQRGVCPHCGEKFVVPAHSIPDIRVESIGVKRGRGRARGEIQDAAAAAIDDVDRGVAVATDIENGEAPAIQRPVVSVAGGPPRDPITEAPAAVWYVRIADGSQFGPAPGEMMRRWLDEGRVAADSLVWREGWAEWGVAGKLFPRLLRTLDPPDIGPGAFAAFERNLAEQVETLVAPSAGAVETAAVAIEANSIRASQLNARVKVLQRRRMALIVLVVAIACLLPVFCYVLFIQ